MAGGAAREAVHRDGLTPALRSRIAAATPGHPDDISDAAGRPAPSACLCESCGYPLPGFDGDGACPECGRAVAESSPLHRTGPLWQRRPSPGAWLDVLLAVAFRPTRFFRTMRADGGNLLPRMYLLSVACLIGGGWALGELLWLEREPVLAWGLGMVAANVVVALTYLEAGGVTFFSRQRGWRVPFRLAERVVCYASPGWVLAAVGLMYLARLHHGDDLVPLLSAVSGSLGPQLVPAVFAAAGGLTLLGFESLVYLGVRQVRFANTPSPGPATGTGAVAAVP